MARKTATTAVLAFCAFLWTVGSAAASPLIEYSVSLDAFSYNGFNYPAATFEFLTDTAALPPFGGPPQQLVTPATYDGFTFNAVGSGEASGCCHASNIAAVGPDFSGNFPAANKGDIEGWFSPLIPWGSPDGLLASGTFYVAVNVSNFGAPPGLGDIHGVQVDGTISRLTISTPEPATWVLMAFGLVLMTGFPLLRPQGKSSP